MLQRILLLSVCGICIDAMALSVTELSDKDFSTKLCATRIDSFNLFGSFIKVERCENPGNGTAVGTPRLSETHHWCVQDYLEMTTSQPSNVLWIPSGCSLWFKERDDLPMKNVDVVDKTGMKRLIEVNGLPQNTSRGVLKTMECSLTGVSLNSGSHDLHGTDYWCRQQTIILPFAGEDPLNSGCSCYVQ